MSFKFVHKPLLGIRLLSINVDEVHLKMAIAMTLVITFRSCSA